MRKDSPEQLCLDIMKRSTCNVQVGAVIYDNKGIISWGWNHDKGGTGCHAEAHAISRANPNRLEEATILIAGQWRKSKNIVGTLPCPECNTWIDKFNMHIIYRNKEGVWE